MRYILIGLAAAILLLLTFQWRQSTRASRQNAASAEETPTNSQPALSRKEQTSASAPSVNPHPGQLSNSLQGNEENVIRSDENTLPPAHREQVEKIETTFRNMLAKYERGEAPLQAVVDKKVDRFDFLAALALDYPDIISRGELIQYQLTLDKALLVEAEKAGAEATLKSLKNEIMRLEAEIQSQASKSSPSN